MIAELVNGSLAVAAAFSLLLLLCIALGKAAGFFSNYKDRQ